MLWTRSICTKLDVHLFLQRSHVPQNRPNDTLYCCVANSGSRCNRKLSRSSSAVVPTVGRTCGSQAHHVVQTDDGFTDAFCMSPLLPRTGSTVSCTDFSPVCAIKSWSAHQVAEEEPEFWRPLRPQSDALHVQRHEPTTTKTSSSEQPGDAAEKSSSQV